LCARRDRSLSKTMSKCGEKPANRGARGAVAEQERIDEAEQVCTPRYWFQGKALNAARKHFSKGAWGDYLRACHISKDQARSARKLARAYDGPELLTQLSVREALRLAKGEPTRPETARLLRNLAARLRHALKAVRRVAQTVETCDERAALVKTIERTGTALSALARGAAKGEHR
ncbi:MAG: hypothetical protein ACREHD_00325, partial [Pirellulales bacterium]